MALVVRASDARSFFPFRHRLRALNTNNMVQVNGEGEGMEQSHS